MERGILNTAQVELLKCPRMALQNVLHSTFLCHGTFCGVLHPEPRWTNVTWVDHEDIEDSDQNSCPDREFRGIQRLGTLIRKKIDAGMLQCKGQLVFQCP